MVTMETETEGTGLPGKGTGSKIAKGWLAWVVFTVVVAIVTGPAIKRSIAESGVAELIAQASESAGPSDMREVQVCFASFDGTFSLYTQTQKKLGGSAYHDCFECLLAGPDEQALEQGAITYIAPGTSLKGLTISEGILFVDLSDRFLESSDLSAASRQLELTAKGFDRIRDIVILVEGKEFSLPEGSPAP
jgi:spore germination protein GerM